MNWKQILGPIVIGVLAFIALKVFLSWRSHVVEAFGFSDGTLIQLSTSHVPTEEDVEQLRQQKRQIDHDLVDMTGSA